MAIKVFIRRTYPRDNEKAFFKCIRDLRSLVPLQPGYISSEYLRATGEASEIVTISTWCSLEDWRAWYVSDSRKTILDTLDGIGGVESEFTVYHHILAH